MGDFLSAVPIIGGALNTLWNTFTGQSQSKSLMRYQQRLNQESINIQNRYNSPVAQMERLRAAGLNPNLVYGNGVDGNTSSAASVGTPSRNPQADFGFADAVNNVFRERQLQNETNLANANKSRILADSLLSQARYLDVMQDVARKDATFGTYVAKAAADLEYTRQAYAESQQRVRESNQRITESVQRVENMKETINQIRANVGLLEARTKTEGLRPSEIRSHINLMNQQATTTKKQRDVMDSIIRLNDRKVEELFYQMMYYSSLGEKIDLENEMTRAAKKFGLQGVTGKDVLNFFKDFLLLWLKD